MDGPASALIGTAALGMGTLVAYAAYKNVPVFGPAGLLTGALQTGKLQPVKTPVAGSGGSTAPAGTPSTPLNPVPGNPFFDLWSWVMKNLVGKGIT